MLGKTSIAFLVCAITAITASSMTTRSATAAAPLGVYEDYAGRDCDHALSCTLYFHALTSDTRVVQASCSITIFTQNASLTQISLGDMDSSARSYDYAEFLGGVQYLNFSATKSEFQVFSQTLHVVTKGRRPAISVSYDKKADVSMACSVHGGTTAFQ
jgi:hypothetical protein